MNRTGRTRAVLFEMSRASIAQVAIDCPTGLARMPSEGEALFKWMQLNVPKWRHTSLRGP